MRLSIAMSSTRRASRFRWVPRSITRTGSRPTTVWKTWKSRTSRRITVITSLLPGTWTTSMGVMRCGCRVHASAAGSPSCLGPPARGSARGPARTSASAGRSSRGKARGSATSAGSSGTRCSGRSSSTARSHPSRSRLAGRRIQGLSFVLLSSLALTFHPSVYRSGFRALVQKVGICGGNWAASSLVEPNEIFS